MDKSFELWSPRYRVYWSPHYRMWMGQTDGSWAVKMFPNFKAARKWFKRKTR